MMFSFPNMPSTSSLFTTYTSMLASAMLVRTVIDQFQAILAQLLPQNIRDKISAKLGGLFWNFTYFEPQTLIVDEYDGSDRNEIYEAAEIYLPTRISPAADELKITKTPRQKTASFSLYKGQKITDEFQGIQLNWEITRTNPSDHDDDSSDDEETSNSFKLSFQKNYNEKVLNTYIPYVLDRARILKEEKKVVKLHTGGGYTKINLDHPSTFDTLAMDPTVKKELMGDLDRFVRRRDYYRRVGKAWKRGYLLYGPPGTGKSSLIAAMANYLKFDIYDLELTGLTYNSELRDHLLSSKNRSILVIEDIDCTIDLEDRTDGKRRRNKESQLTLSGLLNFIDGLWSSTGDEKIFVFTTNYKEKLDPALLRPGRMDMHIHMSYLTFSGFKILASNYLEIKDHNLFTEIEGLINEVEVTPAEVAEELMRSDDKNSVLEGLIRSLKKKKEQKKLKGDDGQSNIEDGEKERKKKGEDEDKENQVDDDDNDSDDGFY